MIQQAVGGTWTTELSEGRKTQNRLADLTIRRYFEKSSAAGFRSQASDGQGAIGKIRNTGESTAVIRREASSSEKGEEQRMSIKAEKRRGPRRERLSNTQ